MKNREIAELFERIADALEVKGETGFKVVAYRKASRILQDMTEDVEAVAREGRLESVPGIGQGLARKITEYIETGKMAKYAEVMTGLPESLLGLLEVQGLGGRTVHLVHDTLGVKDIDGLKRAIADGSLSGLPGMGQKKVDNIRRALEARERTAGRISICEAALVADEVIAYLRETPGVSRVSAAGSLRRMKETVGDIDILACGRNGAEVIRRFTRHPRAVRVLAGGETKGSVVIRAADSERQVDLRVVDESEYGAALLYFTGSKAHNIKLRGLAKERGLKISEYGVFKGQKRLASREEEDCYRVLGMPWIPPEMREDRGEVELALEKKLPRLLEAADIKGDLHVHTRASDGDLSLGEVAGLARKMGYSYIAICDHSQSVTYAHGLATDRLAAEIEEIEAFNRTLKGFRILKGSEVDILADGSLDFPDRLLARLDFVVAAVHSGFKKNVTERMLKALANPHVRTIAHPSGRLISRREGYEVDLDRVIDGAARHGKALELNAYFDRLDLDELHLKKAKQKGVRISIGTDTHFADGLAMMRFGVGIARRAWLEKSDVLNTLDADGLVGRKAVRKTSGKRKP
ncbi:MAG: DNA polymerase/3'-5' exonuclease PolX [Candidatus Aminicenantes bacterium]